MTSTKQSQLLREVQRVQVDVEGQSAIRHIKISLENYDDGLGWYSAASLSIPMHQLPLLQQALQTLGQQSDSDEAGSRTIIPFPGLRVASDT